MLDFGFWIIDCGLRPVRATGAYAPEGFVVRSFSGILMGDGDPHRPKAGIAHGGRCVEDLILFFLWLLTARRHSYLESGMVFYNSLETIVPEIRHDGIIGIAAGYEGFDIRV